jgi:hypothetical protein
MTLTWPELKTYANIVANFYEQNGRDPIGQEHNRIVANVRTIHQLARASRLVPDLN